MDPFLGTFAKDDSLHAAKIGIYSDTGVPWGTFAGTGWTVELEVHKAGTTTVVATLTGAWATVAEEHALFVPGNVALLAPTAPATSADFDALVKLTKLADTAYIGPEGDARVPFRFTVRDWTP